MNRKSIVKLITFTTVSIAAINKCVSILANMNNCFNKDNFLTYESKFGNIKYRKIGTGSPILLIHNLSIGDNINEWNYIVEHLSINHTVYTLNLPGCGNSDKNNFLYTNFMYVKLIIDFINDIISSKTDIVTSGSSNRIAIMTELYNSNVIKNIVMINPSEPPTVKFNHIIGKIINTPILGTFIYNCIFSKKYCLKNTDNNFRLNEYMNTYYDSIHYKGSKSKYLFTSIIMGKTYINYQHAIKNITKETFTYMDNTHLYPHIETPEKTAEYILSSIDK
ncbi:MAG: hypothetical protein K2M78_02060 [Lachnospiraceae bacterium]|nr:hypothetical protein [Lachnospiraceae bacterium]